MGSGGGGDFCPVCREQMLLHVHRRVNPIDDATPHDPPVPVSVKKAGDKWKLDKPEQLPWVLPMQPT